MTERSVINIQNPENSWNDTSNARVIILPCLAQPFCFYFIFCFICFLFLFLFAFADSTSRVGLAYYMRTYNIISCKHAEHWQAVSARTPPPWCSDDPARTTGLSLSQKRELCKPCRVLLTARACSLTPIVRTEFPHGGSCRHTCCSGHTYSCACCVFKPLFVSMI